MITTHILDLSRGKPAAGVPVTLDVRGDDGNWTHVGKGETDGDGRLMNLTSAPLRNGTYRLTFDVATYFRERRVATFFPEVIVVFHVADGEQHHHVPLLLSPWGYSTYRGS